MMLKKSGKAVVIAAALVGSSHVYAEGQTVDVFGTLDTGLQNKTTGKIDGTDADVANALARSGASATPKALSHTEMGGSYTSALFGANATVSDSVKATVEFAVDLGPENPDPMVRARRFYLDADVGQGHIVVGRQGRVFADVAGGADLLLFNNITYSGSVVGPLKASGITYNTGDMIGGTVVSLGLFNPMTGTAASKEVGGNPTPTVEFALSSQFGNYGAKLGVVSESRSLAATDEAGVVTNVDESVSAMGLSLGLNASVSVVDAALVVTAGDAITENTVTGATLSKDAKDKMMAVALHLGTKMDAMNLGLYVGQETLTHAKKNGATDKDGAGADIADVGMTLAFSAGYECSGATWTFEYANTTRTYDSVAIENKSAISLGASTNFSS